MTSKRFRVRPSSPEAGRSYVLKDRFSVPIVPKWGRERERGTASCVNIFVYIYIYIYIYTYTHKFVIYTYINSFRYT